MPARTATKRAPAKRAPARRTTTNGRANSASTKIRSQLTGGKAVKAESLANRLGVSTGLVRQVVTALRHEGHEVSWDADAGTYQMTSPLASQLVTAPSPPVPVVAQALPAGGSSTRQEVWKNRAKTVEGALNEIQDALVEAVVDGEAELIERLRTATIALRSAYDALDALALGR